MVDISRSALVGYSAEQMFDLVNDIENYPSFMQGCKSAKIIERTEQHLTGELCLAKAGISHRFTTKNSLTRPTHIDMQLVEGNFSAFHASWSFDALSDSACKVTLQMQFEFNAGILDYAAGKLFSSSANGLVDALVNRARIVYD